MDSGYVEISTEAEFAQKLKLMLFMCDFRGPWKLVAGQRFLAARRGAASKPVVSNFAPYEKFSAWCRARDEDRIRQFMDDMSQFFKDNPCWE